MIQAIQDFIWGSASLDGVPSTRAGVIRLLRYGHVLLRDLADGELALRAGSLGFTTLLSLVPLLAVSFSVLKGFGVHNQLQPALAQLLAPLGPQAAAMTATIVGFVENMDVGVLGAIGLATLLYTVISTMQKIESAMNYSWRISAVRTPKQRFSDYLSVLVVGPVLIFAALGITGAVSSNSVVNYLASFTLIGAVFERVALLLPYLMIIAAFTFIYLFMPNTRVRFTSALVGGIAGGLLWQTVGWGFARFVAGSTQYTAVYSAFAGLMIFFVWIYLAWLILLVGANVAFYYQHPEHLRMRRREARLGAREREALALTVCKLIGERHYRGELPWTVPALARHLLLPESLVQPVVTALELAGLLASNTARVAGLLPARAWETTTAAEVQSALRDADDEGLLSSGKAGVSEVWTLVRAAEAASTAVLAEHRLSELCRREDRPGKHSND